MPKEITPERGVLVARAGDAAVQHVEDEGRRRQGRGDHEVRAVARSHEHHRQQDGPHAAGGVAEREEVGQVEFPDHGEMAWACALHA
jgi:hypothetical protein